MSVRVAALLGMGFVAGFAAALALMAWVLGGYEVTFDEPRQ